MRLRPVVLLLCLGAGCLAGQEGGPAAPAQPAAFTVQSGTKVPLSLINSISTKHSIVGYSVYLETVFPILADGRIVIPVGSYVMGTVTEVKRPGRVKGRAELYVRFEALALPNGVRREFRARLGSVDSHTEGALDRTEGVVRGEGNKSGDLRTVAETTATGASIGSMAGAAAGHVGAGLSMGAAAGAAAGIIGVLASRGPDAVLTRGTTVEMVLDRSLLFAENEVDFGNYQPRPASSATPPADPKTKSNSFPSSRFPF